MRRALVLLLAAVGGGCIFDVAIEHVKDPGPAFRQARAQAARYQGRPHPARELNVLVYDHGDGKLVRASVPMWLVRKAARDRNHDFEIEGERRRRRHFDLRDIEKAGLGILVEVEEEDGAQVLVWLR